MKIKLFTLVLLATATLAHAQTTNSYGASPNTVLPDGSPVGVMEQFTVNGTTGTIADVQVSLNLAGGFNGDLYAYLTGPLGQQAVLLNRAGVTSGDAFGFSDPGLDLTFDDGGSNSGNIHGYGFGAYSINGGGQVTGTWGSDGRAVDPQSAPGTFDGAATTSNLNQFTGTAADGVWTLYLGDLAGGNGAATLNNWSVTITTTAVPEPQAWTLLAGALLLAGCWRWRAEE